VLIVVRLMTAPLTPNDEHRLSFQLPHFSYLHVTIGIGLCHTMEAASAIIVLTKVPICFLCFSEFNYNENSIVM